MILPRIRPLLERCRFCFISGHRLSDADSYQGIALAIPRDLHLGSPFRGRAPMPRYLLSRVLYTLPVIWLVVSTVFLLIHFVPGDPIQQMLGEGAAAGDIQ